jgi:hypothetical protein
LRMRLVDDASGLANRRHHETVFSAHLRAMVETTLTVPTKSRRDREPA